MQVFVQILRLIKLFFNGGARTLLVTWRVFVFFLFLVVFYIYLGPNNIPFFQTFSLIPFQTYLYILFVCIVFWLVFFLPALIIRFYRTLKFCKNNSYSLLKIPNLDDKTKFILGFKVEGD